MTTTPIAAGECLHFNLKIMIPRHISPALKQHRDDILAELNTTPALSEVARHFITPEGFLEYFNRILDCYPSKNEAYEALEIIHERIMGHRKYSEYTSFRVANRGK